MTINFNFGEHYYTGEGSFYISILVTFIGAFLGFASALWINRIITNNKEEKKVVEKKVLDNDRIGYLAFLLKSIIETTKKQAQNYKELGSKVKENPLETQMPNLIATDDITRLRNLDSLDMYDSFICRFNENEHKVSDYKKIFGTADFLHERLKDAMLQNERHRNFQHKDELFVRDCVEEIFINIGLKVKSMFESFGEEIKKNFEYNYLREFEEIFSGLNKESANFARIRSEYLIPLNNTILDTVSDKEFALKVFSFVKKAVGRLEHVKFNAVEFANDMERIETDTAAAIKFYETQIKMINDVS